MHWAEQLAVPFQDQNPFSCFNHFLPEAHTPSDRTTSALQLGHVLPLASRHCFLWQDFSRPPLPTHQPSLSLTLSSTHPFSFTFLTGFISFWKQPWTHKAGWVSVCVHILVQRMKYIILNHNCRLTCPHFHQPIKSLEIKTSFHSLIPFLVPDPVHGMQQLLNKCLQNVQ